MSIIRTTSGQTYNLRIKHVRSHKADIEGESHYTDPDTGACVNWKVKTVARFADNTGKGVIVLNAKQMIADSKCTINDNFSKKMGVKLAFTRLLHGSGLSKSERSELWEVVNNHRYSPKKLEIEEIK